MKVVMGPFGIPRRFQLNGETWTVVWGMKKGRRCVGRDRCTQWGERPGQRVVAHTCLRCRRITMRLILLKDEAEAWQTFGHECLHLANWNASHKLIDKFENIGILMRAMFGTRTAQKRK